MTSLNDITDYLLNCQSVYRLDVVVGLPSGWCLSRWLMSPESDKMKERDENNYAGTCFTLHCWDQS